jgi:hypothetical protein
MMKKGLRGEPPMVCPTNYYLIPNIRRKNLGVLRRLGVLVRLGQHQANIAVAVLVASATN